MANHCFDVLCLSCGRGWCTRGCGSDWGPSKKSIKIWHKRRKDWHDKFANGILSEINYLSDICECGKRTVVMD